MKTTHNAIRNTYDEIRSFIALELFDEAHAELSRIIESLKKAGADVKWVNAKAIHLTLKFLGSVPEEKIAKIGERIGKIAKNQTPFDIVLKDIGVFPNWDYARVLWVGLESEGANRVKEIANEVETAMTSEGFEKEKRAFSPHLTIGRIRSAKNKKELEQTSLSVKVQPISSHISKIILFKSQLTPNGSIYTPLHVAELEKGSGPSSRLPNRRA